MNHTNSDLDTYNLVLGYLLNEGFASTEQSADKIILNMSEAWFADIMEITGGKGHPGYKAGSKDHGDLEDHPAAGKKGGVLSPRYGNHLGDMDDEDEDEDDLESVVKQQSRDRRETVRKPLRDKVKAARKKMTKEELELVDEARDSEVEKKGRKVAGYEKLGKYQGITSKFRKEYPGSREVKKERGRKPTEGEVEQERIKRGNARVAKHGFTSKEKRESKAREKYDSPRD